MRWVIPIIIDLVARKKKVLFVDEAIFASSVMNKHKVWWNKGAEPPTVVRNAISFPAIAVVAAIDIQGNLVSYLIKDFSIKKPDFIKFLKVTKQKTRGSKTYILLDNLRAHHSKDVSDVAERNNQDLLFNGSYSSELNPIEFLWYLAKAKFRAGLVQLTDYKDVN